MKSFSDYGINIPSTASGEFYTTCPECSSKRKKRKAKCLSVNIEKGVWVCHHCSWSGGLGEKDYKPKYIHWQEPKYQKPKPAPRADLPSKVIKWFMDRGISEQTLIDCKIGYGSVYMPQVEDFVNAIAFPYFRNGEHINTKWRDGSKNFRLETGAERILYGMDDIADAETIIFVEGEADKLSLWEAGFKNAVSVPDGAPPPDADNYSSKFSWLEAAQEALQGKKYIIAVDSDAPGKKLSDELSRRLGRGSCLSVEWPSGCKDANEVLKEYRVDGLKNCIEWAKPFPIEGVFTAIDSAAKIYHLWEHGFEKGVSCGWESLDDLFLARPGEFTVVTGIPNSGKSNFIDAMAVNLSKIHGWRFAMFSPENQPLEDHQSRIIEKWAGKPFNSGPNPRISHDEMDEAINEIGDRFFWILPDDDSEWSIDMVLERTAELVYQKGIRGLVIDPWNELEHARSRGENETDYISRSLKRIRQFGRRYGVHVFIVVHPQKLYKDKDGNYPVPTLYDCAGSAHWRNKADNGFCVWRDFTDDQSQSVDIHVQKIRFRQNGKIGMCSLAYNWLTSTYHELSKARDEIPPKFTSYRGAR